MSTWTIECEPPQQLIIESKKAGSPTERKIAAEHLGHLAHVGSVDMLIVMLDDQDLSVRHTAINSLAQLMESPTLVEYRSTVGVALCNRLPVADDQICIVRAVKSLMDSSVVAESVINAIKIIINASRPPREPYYFLEALRLLMKLPEDECNSATERLILAGLVNPKSRPAIVENGLIFLSETNPKLALMYIRCHLQSDVSGGYFFRLYGHNYKSRLSNCYDIRLCGIKIILKLIKKEIDSPILDCKTEMAKIIGAVAQMAKPKPNSLKGLYCEEYESRHSLELLHQFASKIPAVLSEEFLGHEAFMTLPQEIRDRITK